MGMGVKIFGDTAVSKYGTPRNSHFDYADRTWPGKKIEKAPIWCSVDLRDGNQALPNPMTVDEKIDYFKILLEMGFKEIEVGFPSASEEDFNFLRKIIDESMIPDDVKIQVLVPCREELIKKTKVAVSGAKNVIIHLYNSTSTQQRQIVFGNSKEKTIKLALNGTNWIKDSFKDFEGNLFFQYSPESFTATEMDFAKDIYNAVKFEWDGFGGNPIIINLPATVENSGPDVYADKIEWMISHIKNQVGDKVETIISLHPHNDRGCAVAATELALKAGADRVEGTLFGQGERTGNVDIVTLCGNMYSQGVRPGLDLSNIGDIAERVVTITQIPIHPRHPYVGELSFTAFSGSHQDAIKKGFDNRNEKNKWEIPYLPVDPKDLGGQYEPVEINSQSGKGGVAFILKKQGYDIPKGMQPVVGKKIQQLAEQKKCKLKVDEIVTEFQNNFVNVGGGISTKDFTYEQGEGKKGIIKQFADFITKKHNIKFHVVSYGEYSKSKGRGANAITCFEIKYNGNILFGIGEDEDIAKSCLLGLTSCLNIAMSK